MAIDPRVLDLLNSLDEESRNTLMLMMTPNAEVWNNEYIAVPEHQMLIKPEQRQNPQLTGQPAKAQQIQGPEEQLDQLLTAYRQKNARAILDPRLR